jgi:glycosyltransferase involved in cell wall biosynthesis
MRCRLDLEVCFWRPDGLGAGVVDPETGQTELWDNLSVIEGYTYYQLPSRIPECWRFLLEKALSPSDGRVVVINGWTAQALRLAFLAALLKRVPIIYRLDTVDLYPVPPLKSAFRRIFRSALYRVPIAFMVTSSLTRQHLRRFGVRDESIFLFPYAVDNELLTRTSDLHSKNRIALRGSIGLGPTEAVIMSPIKFVHREGVWDLVRAYAGLESHHASSVLLLVGDGPLRPEVEAFCRERRSMNVVFTGWVPYSRLIELYAASDLFVHPGIEERWGCSVQEAAACRLPIIGSDLVGATYDLVKPGINGVAYKGGSVEALRNAIATMLTRRDEWPAMGDESLRIAQDWGHENAILELERAVDFALAHGRRSARVGK